LRDYTRPAEESAFDAAYAIILDERSRVFPLAESDAVMVGTSAKVKNDSQDNKPDNGNNFDGTGSRNASVEEGVKEGSRTRK
jgi:hypothetical protein